MQGVRTHLPHIILIVKGNKPKPTRLASCIPHNANLACTRAVKDDVRRGYANSMWLGSSIPTGLTNLSMHSQDVWQLLSCNKRRGMALHIMISEPNRLHSRRTRMAAPTSVILPYLPNLLSTSCRDGAAKTGFELWCWMGIQPCSQTSYSTA
jgi:hypothetical protein